MAEKALVQFTSACALEFEINRWKSFRKALVDDEEKQAFDEIMDIARINAMAASPLVLNTSFKDEERVCGWVNYLCAKFEVLRNIYTMKFYWYLRADNGEIIAHGETYSGQQACMDTVNLIK
jgi:uncharacterized protein YegP (UPF0339 family)